MELTSENHISERLTDLKAHWLTTGEPRYGMGVAFPCVAHENCTLRCWFVEPLDGEAPIANPATTPLYDRVGHELDSLGILPPIIHGDLLVLVWDGTVRFIWR